MKSKYQVTVGNIGTVYDGSSLKVAKSDFAAYRDMSKNAVGKAAGESVTLWSDGEPIKEYVGALDREAGAV